MIYHLLTPMYFYEDDSKFKIKFYIILKSDFNFSFLFLSSYILERKRRSKVAILFCWQKKKKKVNFLFFLWA